MKARRVTGVHVDLGRICRVDGCNLWKGVSKMKVNGVKEWSRTGAMMLIGDVSGFRGIAFVDVNLRNEH